MDRSEVVTIPYNAWEKHPTFEEGNARLVAKYADLHGSDSDYSKGKYGESLRNEDTVVRMVRNKTRDRLDAVWLLKRAPGYLKMRSSWWRDLQPNEREVLFSRLQSMSKEQGLPLIIEPDVNDNALADTFNNLGFSTVWDERELLNIMGEDYARTHVIDSTNKFGHLKFRVTNTLGTPDMIRRASVSYPEWMVKKKTVARGIAVYEDTTYMLQKDETSSQPNAWEWPGGTVDPGEDVTKAFVREMVEETNCEKIRKILEKATRLGEVSYQFWKGRPQQSTTVVFRANFEGSRPDMGFNVGTDDHHKGAEWKQTGPVWNGEVVLTRPCDLIRRNFEK